MKEMKEKCTINHFLYLPPEIPGSPLCCSPSLFVSFKIQRGASLERRNESLKKNERVCYHVESKLDREHWHELDWHVDWRFADSARLAVDLEALVVVVVDLSQRFLVAAQLVAVRSVGALAARRVELESVRVALFDAVDFVAEKAEAAVAQRLGRRHCADTLASQNGANAIHRSAFWIVGMNHSHATANREAHKTKINRTQIKAYKCALLVFIF